jgi:hypothetical protein
LLETVSHELNLHLVPWARVMMLKEFQSLDTAEELDNYPAEQLERIYTTLSYSGDLQKSEGRARLLVDIRADAANKFLFALTGKGLGNHSDIGLWLLHLKTIANLANQQADPAVAAEIASVGIEKMIFPMRATGKPEHAIVRNVDVLDECRQILRDLRARYKNHVPNKKQFKKNIRKVRKLLEEYEANAKGARATGNAAVYTDPRVLTDPRALKEEVSSEGEEIPSYREDEDPPDYDEDE